MTILQHFNVIFETLIWLLTGTVVFLTAMVGASHWWQQHNYRSDKEQLELAVNRLFDSYMLSGRWPVARDRHEHQALRWLTRRLGAGVKSPIRDL